MAVVVVGPRTAGHGAAKFFGRRRGQFFGGPVGQAENGLAVRGRRRQSVCADLWRSAAADLVEWTLTVSVWSAVLLTIYSGLEYIRRAVGLDRLTVRAGLAE